jgi:hypothetical protein
LRVIWTWAKLKGSKVDSILFFSYCPKKSFLIGLFANLFYNSTLKRFNKLLIGQFWVIVAFFPLSWTDSVYKENQMKTVFYSTRVWFLWKNRPFFKIEPNQFCQKCKNRPEILFSHPASPLLDDSDETLATNITTHPFSSPAHRRLSALQPVCAEAMRAAARHFFSKILPAVEAWGAPGRRRHPRRFRRRIRGRI